MTIINPLRYVTSLIPLPRLLVEIRGIEEGFQVALPGPGCNTGPAKEKQRLTGWKMAGEWANSLVKSWEKVGKWWENGSKWLSHRNMIGS